MITVTNPYKRTPHLSEAEYQRRYQQSIESPETFWREQAAHYLSLHTPFETVQSGPINHTHWFKGATLNACYHCLDRHLPARAKQVAFYWESDDGQTISYSYQALFDDVCRMSNVLKAAGVKKGDRVCLYLPMILEAPIAMLACARIGAIHSVVFAGFSATALASRINDADCCAVITATRSLRGGKSSPLKANVDLALTNCPGVKKVLVIDNDDSDASLTNDRDIAWSTAKHKVAPLCQAEPMDAESPLFILYTSGSTGKPKGVVHTTAGYLLYAQMTFTTVFDYQQGDVYWCAADIGWITGHSYIVYGPLASGATSVLFEGVPNYPQPDRAWQVIDKYKVNQFYTAPTALRALKREGKQWLTSTSRKSLLILGSVGEPINPEVWQWYFDDVGHGRCPIVDTWWQTETGGIMLSALPSTPQLKPGCAQRPFFGVNAGLIDEQGAEAETKGLFVIKQAFPSIARTLYGDEPRYQATYFKNGQFISGDGARLDQDGDFKISGRTDDVLNVSGHRLGTAEIESAIVSHPDCSEAAVIGIPHALKGQAITAFISLRAGMTGNDDLVAAVKQTVSTRISPIAKPEFIIWTNDLPKTRSGKIMRRILRQLACGQQDDLGDTSTLADSSVIAKLINALKGAGMV